MSTTEKDKSRKALEMSFRVPEKTTFYKVTQGDETAFCGLNLGLALHLIFKPI